MDRNFEIEFEYWFDPMQENLTVVARGKKSRAGHSGANDPLNAAEIEEMVVSNSEGEEIAIDRVGALVFKIDPEKPLFVQLESGEWKSLNELITAEVWNRV